ncbi:hypothetical protein K4F52_004593 [Lecanicillium sp. MT-2017a]|nr:hypothetical protein K4F52_004593 [Lecanicillium sp. MT-2017a]
MVQIASTVLLAVAASGVQACTGPIANQDTINLVSSFESFKPNVYKDPVGKDTIGYGHLCQQPGCGEVKFPKPLSEADGKKLLSQDMAVAQDCITTHTAQPVTLNANQYGALVSWAFNIGCGNAQKSDLIKRLNKGEDPGKAAHDELPQWNKGGGKVLPGLVRRRKEELALFDKPTGDPALPAKC